MNWKVRFRNPVFWATLVPALIGLIYTFLGLTEIVPPISESGVINAITTIITALTTIGVFVDPTTKGLSDSAQAMTYEKPGGDIIV